MLDLVYCSETALQHYCSGDFQPLSEESNWKRSDGVCAWIDLVLTRGSG